jgi:Tol biopolymer transport system component
MSRARALLTVLAAALGACSTNPGNPFANTVQTVVPRAESAIVFSTNSYATVAGAPRELFAVEASGAGLVRLTFCNADPRRCDTSEAAPAPDRQRMAMLRATDDTNSDGRLTGADGQALLVVDLSRAVEGQIFAQSSHVTGVDWSRGGEVLVYSADGDGAVEDLYRVDPNGQNNRNLTVSANVRERRPRLDPTASLAVYERIEGDGVGQIFVFNSTLAQARVTSGGTPGPALANTPYLVGSDADPDYSPDGRTIVFRRLTGTGNGGLGTWDLMTVKTDGSALSVVATGPAFRGAPDWGVQGIVFAEVDVAAGTSQLVVVQPDGTGRRSLLSVPATLDISNPRWLP